MLQAYIRTAVTILSAVALLGCARMYNSGETALDKNWGRSFESAKHGQILNPDAWKNPAPVAGIVGPAGEIAMEWYLKSYVDPNTSKGRRKSTISAVTIQP
ncbi:MAG: hypothetical protein C4576_28760 [Desulfobacteraceae bacterium]|nr:MAG: hypothetical protein C4576_28760 [Desulfobacteraceae bacterium]